MFAKNKMSVRETFSPVFLERKKNNLHPMKKFHAGNRARASIVNSKHATSLHHRNDILMLSWFFQTLLIRMEIYWPVVKLKWHTKYRIFTLIQCLYNRVQTEFSILNLPEMVWFFSFTFNSVLISLYLLTFLVWVSYSESD